MPSNYQNPSWSAGSKITSSNLNLGEPVWSYKAADQSLTSTTGMINDNDLFLTLAASGTYFFDAYIVYSQNVANGSGDIKSQWTVPSGASLFVTSFGLASASSLTTYDVTAQPAQQVRVWGVNLATAMSAQPRGYVQTNGTGGTLQFQWAQNTSSTTPLYVKAGSWLRAWRVA